MAASSRCRPPPSARRSRAPRSTSCWRSGPPASSACARPSRTRWPPRQPEAQAVRLVLATRNEHKLRELSELLRPHELEPLPGDVALPPETGTTFKENALIKGRAAAAAIEAPVVADDSGIQAAALKGAPGVFSARFAGEGASDQENLDKLLREVPPGADPGLSYVCVLAYVEPGGRQIVVDGRCEGQITHEPRGDGGGGRAGRQIVGEGRGGGQIPHEPRGDGGFGYDPAFVPADYDDGRTM